LRGDIELFVRGNFFVVREPDTMTQPLLYNWEQGDSHVDVSFRLPPGITKANLSVKIEAGYVVAGVKGLVPTVMVCNKTKLIPTLASLTPYSHHQCVAYIISNARFFFWFGQLNSTYAASRENYGPPSITMRAYGRLKRHV
jgi:hypothetical protein